MSQLEIPTDAPEDTGLADAPSHSVPGDDPLPDHTAPTVGIGEPVPPTRRVTPISPITPETAPPVITEKAGDWVGPCRLIRKIGEGGFGVVWEAEQCEPISRKVALKVIKAGMDTHDVLARFDAERQALAMMDHSHIAKVLDAGATKSGRPYFLMELVDGIPITKFCDEETLGPRQRLELFQTVCSAVNHAHQKGIIHRDLKPSNVMVTRRDGEAVVKVIDFGIAKATESKLTKETLVTRLEQVLGTPVYMSPEQTVVSGLDIDTRSDIYSLGALLYELLTGRPPFDPKLLTAAGFEEMRRIILHEDPPIPSLKVHSTPEDERSAIMTAHGIEPQKLGRRLKGDLDWIVMKAIEKERPRRYQTANAFAADIGRFLNDEPVLAAAPSASYKFRKFARRNRAALLTGSLIAAVLVVATAVSTRQAIRATKAEAHSTTLLTESERAREEAERARARAARARQEAKATANVYAEIIRNLDPARNPDGETLTGVLSRVAEQVESDASIDPDLKARLQSTLARTYDDLGLHLEARRLKRMVRDHYLETHGPYHRLTLEAMEELAAGG